MRNSKITIPLISLAAVLLISGYVLGNNSDMSIFNSYNTLNPVLDNSCTVCHTSGSSLNPYGSAYSSNGRNNNALLSIASNDSDGDGFSNSAEITAGTFPGNANSRPTTTTDNTRPTVTAFTIPATATSLTVPISTLTATDTGGSGVNGYMVTTTNTPPAATAAGWSTNAPTTFSFPTGTSGAQTLYAWAKDGANNVSTGRSAGVTITTGGGEVDVESPEVMEFTLPLTSASLTVPIVAFRAIDNVEATEHLITYLITTTPAAPAANAAGWRATPHTNYTFPSGGSKTLYGWAKDAAGNISESLWDNVDIAAATDQTPPMVTSFSIPSTSRTFAVLIRRFTATDNTAVTGYLVTTSSTKPGASNPNWRSTPPTSFTFTSTGRKRLYAWAKDAAGNVSSASRYGTVMVLGNNQEEDD